MQVLPYIYFFKKKSFREKYVMIISLYKPVFPPALETGIYKKQEIIH